MSVHAVVLAAGASSRYGVSPPKQAELLPQVLVALRRSDALDGVLVVLGAHDVAMDVPAVRCPEWERGPGASLRCGLGSLPADAEAAVVVLADGPDLDPEAVDRVVSTWRETGHDVVAAVYGGVRLHPVLLDRLPEPGEDGEFPCAPGRGRLSASLDRYG